jgi:hypothetical protein
MNRAVLGLATDRGVIILKPGTEATEYTRANQGLLNRRCGCISRLGDGKLAVGTDDFFVQLSSDGQEWRPSLDGLSRPHVTCLARHPKHKLLLFAGTSSPAVFMSKDNGESWKVLAPLESMPSASRWTSRKAPFRAKVSAVTCHPEHAGLLLASIEVGGLGASKDGGKTWVPRDKGLPPDVRFLIAPAVSGRLYTGTGAGFYRSDDLGGTWAQKTKGLPYQQVRSLCSADSNPDLIVMSVSGKDDGLSALVQSQNGGESWEVIGGGLPRMDNRIVTCITFGRGGFYAGTDQGDLFGLDNMDGRWTRLGSHFPPINAIAALA